MHLDLDVGAGAGFAGGFFALYVPSPRFPDPTGTPYAVPLAEPIPHEEAARIAEELFAALCELPVTRATSAADFEDGRVAAIVHMEGAEPIAPDLSNLEDWYERGLALDRPDLVAAERLCRRRAVSLPVVARHGRRADRRGPRARPGVQPARHPRRPLAPQLGRLLGRRPALGRAARRDALERARALRVVAQPRRRAARRDRAPRAASSASTSRSRSCARTGSSDRDTPITEIVRHVDYLRRADGHRPRRLRLRLRRRVVPDELGGVAGLPKLVDALRASGHDDEAVAKITHRNWLRVLDATWR